MVDEYTLGATVRIGNHSGDTLRDAFRTVNGTATDPTAVLLTVRRPDGTHAVYGYPTPGADGTLTKQGTGVYYQDVACSLGGLWHWRLAGTGAVAVAAEGEFWVWGTEV